MKNIPKPSGKTKDVPETSFENLIEGVGWIDIGKLMFLVPEGTQNTWTANPTDRIQKGFKYVWEDKSGIKYTVHGHEEDGKAPHGSVAKNNWIVRIRHGNRYLLTEKVVEIQEGVQKNWSANDKYANLSHIPAILQE